MAKKKTHQLGSIRNPRARHDYELGDTMIVGIALSGAETKALRQTHGHLRGAYVTVKDNELWLINSTVTGSTNAPIAENEQTQARKLLASRKEINQLILTKQQGLTIVPLEILTRGRFIKLRIAAARGKKQYDKRQALKSREENRRIESMIKSNTKTG